VAARQVLQEEGREQALSQAQVILRLQPASRFSLRRAPPKLLQALSKRRLLPAHWRDLRSQAWTWALLPACSEVTRQVQKLQALRKRSLFLSSPFSPGRPVSQGRTLSPLMRGLCLQWTQAQT
jgi:hypothetical protein